MNPPVLTRRAALGGIALAGGATFLPAAGEPSLAGLAASRGLLFGTAVGAGPAGRLTGMMADKGVMALVARECGVIVPENEMKQYVVAARPGPPTSGPATGWRAGQARTPRSCAATRCCGTTRATCPAG